MSAGVWSNSGGPGGALVGRGVGPAEGGAAVGQSGKGAVQRGRWSYGRPKISRCLDLS